MTTTRKDLEEIARAIFDAQLVGRLSYAEAKTVVDVLTPALTRTTGLNPNGNSRFDPERFERAAIWTGKGNNG